MVLDVVRMGVPIGSVVELPLAEVSTASVDGKPLSSHELGVAQAMAMAEALGRALPPGLFVGIGARVFEPGTELSREVALAVDDLIAAAQGAIAALDENL